MPSNSDIFEQMVKLHVFRAFSRFALSVFGINISVADSNGLRGMRLGGEAGFSTFCARVQLCPAVKEQCLKCDSIHFKEARLRKHPLRYVCHLGFTEFVIPVVIDDDVIALVQCGQMLDKKPTAATWKSISRRLTCLGLDPGPLKKFFFAVNVNSPSRQRDLVELLQALSHYAASSTKRLMILERSRSSSAVVLAQTYVESHYNEHLSLSLIATAARSSARNLTRLFRRNMNMTVVDYVHKVRIRHACRMLAETDKTVLAVSMECGFNNVQQFNRVFRRIRGMTPSRFRRRRSV